MLGGDSGVWSGVGYSRSVATGGSARVATGKRRGGAGADRIGQDLHLRAALSEPENSGGVHRPPIRAVTTWKARMLNFALSVFSTPAADTATTPLRGEPNYHKPLMISAASDTIVITLR